MKALETNLCKPSRSALWTFLAGVIFTGLAVSACTTPMAGSALLTDSTVTPEMLLQRGPLGTDGAVPETLVGDILELTPEMLAFIEQNVDPDENQLTRLKQLVYAIMGTEQFQLIYDDRTRTARETFFERRGNCLSFTNLFVAMARHVGIDASYQEVEIPPDWSLTGQSFLLSKHVNVFLHLRHGETRIVDFNVYDFSTTFARQVISDERARAHYFNNIGAERMLNGETGGALANFRASLSQDAGFSPAWVNLGVLYRREGYREYAEAAFLQALEFEPGSLVAMSNLASLYQEAGLTEEAAAYQHKVQTHRMRNPFYRYYLANEAFASGDYQTAIGHLKYAIQRQENEPRFFSLLSLSYLMSGDRAEAQLWMQRAKQASTVDQDEEKYGHKLKWLMQQQP